MANKGDRTEKPTPKRRRESRREGRIARTPELASWASVLAASYLLQVSLGLGARRLRGLLDHAARAAAQPDTGTALAVLGEGLRTAVVIVAPVAAGLMAVGVITNLAQVGFAPSGKALRPKLDRLNPLKGLRRLLSPETGWEAAKTVLKLAILAWFAVRAVTGIVPDLIDGGRLPVDAIVALVGGRALSLVRQVAAAGLALAVLDYAFQKRRLAKSLAMTKQEVKEEHRQSEGDPHMKGAIRARQLAMSRNRMMAEVSRADVVVVNPTHVAVALRYDPARGAPRVVAKGAGAVAARIREEAERHRVPMVQDIPLARTIHRACDLGDEVPPDLYDAVARVLAFIFALKGNGAADGLHQLPGSRPAIPGVAAGSGGR